MYVRIAIGAIVRFYIISACVYALVACNCCNEWIVRENTQLCA